MHKPIDLGVHLVLASADSERYDLQLKSGTRERVPNCAKVKVVDVWVPDRAPNAGEPRIVGGWDRWDRCHYTH